MKEQEIQTLIGQCIAFFQENNYSRNRIGVYKTLWRHGIVPFMEARGLRKYQTSVGAMFIETCHRNGTVRQQEREKIRHKENIAENHIVSFVLAHPINKVNIVSALRVLFRFWKEEGLLERDFSQFFESFRVRHPERVSSFFTKEEVLRIENSIARSNAVGKRNYAMTLLASRLGLRASDIANLKFGEIDWDNNLLTITMQKTRKIIQLPLLSEVGNSIVDYLKNGRPKSSLDQVFLSSRAPYTGATKACVCAAINEIILKSGVDVHLKHHGPHSLRHSLASAMLSEETTLPVISESLGHRHTDTTMVYLKIDIPSLMKCALPVPSVAEGFYMQRGGAFYE